MQISFRNFLWICAIILLAACKNEKPAKRLPVDAFFRNPIKTTFLISPNGKYISFLQPYNNRLNIYVQNVDGGEAIRVTDEKDRNISSYFWASNDQLLYMKDRIASEGSHLYSVKRSGGNSTDILPGDNFRIKLINTSLIKRDELLVSLNKRDSSVFDVFRLNVKTGKLILAVQNPGNITEWYSDYEGKIRLALASDGVNETLLYRDSENESFTAVLTSNFKTNITPVGFCGTERSCIYALSNQNRDKSALVEFDCKTGKEKRIIYGHSKADVVDGGYSIAKRKLTFATYETWKRKRHFIDSTMKHIYDDIEAKLPNNEIVIASRDSAENQFVVKTYTDKSPGAFYLYTLANKRLIKLSDINSSLPEAEMCEMKPINFQSRDGVTIHGYITYPKGLQETNLPVVVLPHGGPESRNSWGFNSEVQFLANRGYAVFQINFRGSKGYGKEFWISGFKNWGTSMQDDITDGVNWLIKNKTADPERIAIYGTGFGGYAALHGLCFHPELYACGASYSGLINLFTYIKGVPPYFKPYLQMYYEKVGNPEKDADYFRAVSPVFHTEKIKKPVLLVQDAKDPRANINEANQFVREIKKHKVSITYSVKNNDSRDLGNQEDRQEFYRELEKFLAENLNKK